MAGVHAVQELLEAHLRPARGRLILIPVMNPGAYRARERAAPADWTSTGFPGDAQSVVRSWLARATSTCASTSAQRSITLHESKKRYDPRSCRFREPSSTGWSRCPASCSDRRCPQPQPVVRRRSRAPQYYPVATSSTEIIVDTVGCIGLCIETWMGFPERRRIDMQKEVVELLLADVGVL